MARSPRLDYKGAWHHVMNRGARKAPIFSHDDQAGTFLQLVGETALRFELEVHAYAVMPNHYHLLVRSVHGNLSRAMRHLGACYTQDINRRYGWDGPVFRGRFRSQLVEDESYLLTVVAYIHLNPFRAGLARRLDQHCWTSHRAYLWLDLPPEWLHRELILSMTGAEQSFAEYVAALRRGAEPWPNGIDVTTGWLATNCGQTPWTLHRGNIQDRAISDTLPTAEQVLEKIEAVTGISQQDLRNGKYGRGANVGRRFAIWALARSTQLTQVEIGALLGLSAPNVAVTLRRLGPEPAGRLQEWVQKWLQDPQLRPTKAAEG